MVRNHFTFIISRMGFVVENHIFFIQAMHYMKNTNHYLRGQSNERN